MVVIATFGQPPRKAHNSWQSMGFLGSHLESLLQSSDNTRDSFHNFFVPAIHNFRVEAQDRSCNFFFPDVTVDIIFVCSRIHTHYRIIAKNANRGLLVVMGGRCNY
jgi:hypothetical protein